MLCEKCGTPMPENIQFCPHCGSAVENRTGQHTPVPEDWSLYARPADGAEQPPAQPQGFVWPEFMQIPVEAEFKEPEKKEKRPLNKKKLLLRICAVVLVLVAVTAVLLQTVTKTVYLQTLSESEQGGVITRYSYAYDPEGRIVKMVFQTEYDTSKIKPTLISTITLDVVLYYFYAPDGNLKTAEIHYGQNLIQVEYNYEDGVLKDFTLSTEDETAALDVRCDKKGRIEYVGVLADDGEEQQSWEFTYDNDGTLEQCIFREGERSETVTKYDQAGHQIKTKHYMDGNLIYKYVNIYDDHGNLIERSTNYDALMGPNTSLKIGYTYNGDRIMDMRVHTGDTVSDLEEWIEFDCHWDGNECEMTVESAGDETSLLGVTGEELESIRILLEKDDAGNTLGYEVYIGDELCQAQRYEYEAYKLPWYYGIIRPQTDPLYMCFLLDAF